VILVVDASAAYDLLEESLTAEKLLGAKELIAPDLIVAELLNARWKVARSGLAAPSLERTLTFLERLRLVPSIAYAREAAALAEQLDHPAYDCFYVATAQREGAKFLTLDERLLRKVRLSKHAGIARLLL